MRSIDDIIAQAARDGAFETEFGRGRPYRITDTGPGWWVRRKMTQIKEEQIREEQESAGGGRPLPDPWVPPKERGSPPA